MRNKIEKPFLLFLIFILPTLAFPDHPKNLIRTNLTVDPTSLDPALAEDDASMKVLANTMDGLTGYDGAGKLKNNLAETIIASRGGLVYTATLRKNAKWSDGKPVTASEFVAGIKRSLDPKLASKLGNMFFAIKGAKAYYTGKASADALGVTESKGKIIFELTSPVSYFLHLLTQPQASPIREDVLAANGGKWPDIAPSTGAYQIVKRVRGEEVLLEPNKHYWRALPKIASVHLRVIPNDSTALSLFETGDLDAVARVAPLEVARLRKAGLAHDFVQAGTGFLTFNTRKPPFNDREFRQALAGALDREEIIKIMGTSSLPATSWIPVGLEGFRPFDKKDRSLFSASLEKIKARIKANGSPEVLAAFNNSEAQAFLMEKMQNDAKTKLGLDVKLTKMDWATYLSTIKNNTPQIYRFGRTAAFMDPIWHLASFQGNDANNFTGWKNETYDHLVDQIAATPSGKKREKLIQKAQKILVEDEAIVIPIYHLFQSHAVSKRLKGYRQNPLSAILFSEITLQ